MNRRAAAAAVRRAAPRNVNPAVNERRAADTVNRNGHVRESGPRVTHGIVNFVLGENAERMILVLSLAAPNVKAAIRFDAIHATARRRHRRFARPSLRTWVEHFENVCHFTFEPAAETTTHYINLSTDCRGREVISCRRHIR